MNIQLALDRLTIARAIELGQKVRPYVEWIEVGTSLIKEFGMQSVRELRQAFPDKTLVADVKTFDNAQYEFRMCFEAGADVATVMGAAPFVSISACVEEARKYGKQVMVDLLNTSAEQVQKLMEFHDAIFCLHISKDQQELSGKKQEMDMVQQSHLPLLQSNFKIAVAGGITVDTLAGLSKLNPEVVIVGSAITKVEDPGVAAKEIHARLVRLQGGSPE